MRFVCLAYHRVASDQATVRDPYAVTQARFRAHMAWLARCGYTGVSLATAMKAGKGTRPIALTFDDGYLDFYTTAWPILQEFGFSATVFVVTEAIGQTANWAGATAMRLMSWGDLSRLGETCIEIGAHGATHRPLDDASPDETRHDLTMAYQTLSRLLGHAPIGMAYPYGCWSSQVAAAAEAAGFRWGCTARGGINYTHTPLFKLRRTLVRSGTGLLRFAWQVWTGYANWIEWRMDVRQIP